MSAIDVPPLPGDEKLTRGGDTPGRFTIARYRREYTKTWAMLISRVYQVDPLRCEKCGGAMRVVSVITPHRPRILERILKQERLWDRYPPRPPPSHGPIFSAGETGAEPGAEGKIEDYEYVPIDRFPAEF